MSRVFNPQYPGEEYWRNPSPATAPLSDIPGPETTVPQYGSMNPIISRAYLSPMAQAQRLRDHQKVLPDFETKVIFSPDAQSQTEIGYTQPIQAFGINNPNQVGGVPSASIPSPVASQPNLVQAQPSTAIPTGMPWNY